MATPIKKPCDTSYRAVRTSGVRDPKSIKWVVVHDTEGGSAKSVALMFSRDDAQASTHLVVDELECYRMLDNKDIPWGATGANTKGFHIEHVGFARWTRGMWLDHDVTLRRGAYKAALHMVAWDIPARWVGFIGLRLGRKGLTTHADVSKAWPGSGHTDPGPEFPKDVYLQYVKEYIAEITGV
jgi:hypothetical protein